MRVSLILSTLALLFVCCVSPNMALADDHVPGPAPDDGTPPLILQNNGPAGPGPDQHPVQANPGPPDQAQHNGPVQNGPMQNGPVQNGPVHNGPVNNGPGAAPQNDHPVANQQHPAAVQHAPAPPHQPDHPAPAPAPVHYDAPPAPAPAHQEVPPAHAPHPDPLGSIQILLNLD